MATKKDGGRGYSSADKFTWKAGDVQIYKNEAEWRAAVAAEKKRTASTAKKSASAKPKKKK